MACLFRDGAGDMPDPRLVTVLVSSVRTKLRAATERKDLIGYALGQGYQLTDSLHDIYPPAPPARWHVDAVKVRQLSRVFHSS